MIKIIDPKLEGGMLDDIYSMRQALIEAGKAAGRGEVLVGVAVVYRERIIARAHNLTETLDDVTTHIEVQVIIAVVNMFDGKYSNECTLHATVKPYIMCARAIAQAQTGRLISGAEDGKRGHQRYAGSALHPKTVVVEGITADGCAILMREFSAAKWKQKQYPVLFDLLKIYIFTTVLGEYFFMSFFWNILGVYFLFVTV